MNWAMGAKRYAGKDVDLFVGNAQEVVDKTGNWAHEFNAGFWDEGTNSFYINTDAEVSSMTLLHEVFHPTETGVRGRRNLTLNLRKLSMLTRCRICRLTGADACRNICA